jgi:hypothetical protein
MNTGASLLLGRPEPGVRRIQLSFGGGHLRARPANQPHPPAVGPFRELSHIPSADVPIEISAGSGADLSGRAGARRAPDGWLMDQPGTGVRGGLLDATGLASSALGIPGGGPRSFTPEDLSMVGTVLLGRGGGNARWGISLWRPPPAAAATQGTPCPAHGRRVGHPGQQPALRGTSGEPPGGGRAGELDGRQNGPPLRIAFGRVVLPILAVLVLAAGA